MTRMHSGPFILWINGPLFCRGNIPLKIVQCLRGCVPSGALVRSAEFVPSWSVKTRGHPTKLGIGGDGSINEDALSVRHHRRGCAVWRRFYLSKMAADIVLRQCWPPASTPSETGAFGPNADELLMLRKAAENGRTLRLVQKLHQTVLWHVRPSSNRD